MHLLFDLDGTLTDSREGVVRCMQHALEHLGRRSPPPADLATFIGPPLAGTFATLLGTADPALVEEAIAAYRARFERVGIFENAVYPGIRDALAELAAAGHDLYVVTVKPRRYARQILEHVELAGVFTAVHGPELGHREHTKRALIRELCTDARVPARRAVMIGDRAEDIVGAKENGLASIGVTWGYGSRAELEAAQPDVLVGSSAELVARIRRVASAAT
jgi:phosphoglycolate phosphatase